MCVCVCVCVCVHARACADCLTSPDSGYHGTFSIHMCVCVCVCMRAYVRMYACMREMGRERGEATERKGVKGDH